MDMIYFYKNKSVMNKFLTAFLLLVQLHSFAQPVFKADDHFLKSNFKNILPGLYMSKYELSNELYRSFITEARNTFSTDQYELLLPDSNVWNKSLSYGEPFKMHYFQHAAYNEYPVVGISYEAANAFCQWLTNQYNQNPNRKFKKIQFQLPTKADWQFAANKGDSTKMYTWGTGFVQNNRKQWLANFTHTRFEYDSIQKKYIELPPSDQTISVATTNIKAFFPNDFGLYNICGNVAEMLQEKGLASGGGFLDPAYNIRISSIRKYEGPAIDLGFRLCMKVIEE